MPTTRTETPAPDAGGRLPLAEDAYRRLKRRILDNEIPPGTNLLEQEVAALLGMSRTPVREAMLRLAGEGMVEVRPRHGMRVLPIAPEDMREIYEVLTALESEAAGLVAAAGAAGEQLRAMRDAVAEMDAALERDDLAGWAEADEHFHALLVDACPNARLRALVRQFWDQAHRVRMVTLRLRPKPAASNRDHMALVEAIERGDADAARDIHRKHRIAAGDMLVRLLLEYRLKSL